jgi:glutathione synthase/RimK-type ligase-like ATP-grasp enzyme
MKVAFATSSDYPVLSGSEESLPKAFQDAGLDAEVVIWDDASVEWSDYSHVIIRSCWDYHLRIAEFQEWIRELENAGIRVHNSPDLLRWNLHKSYLLDLQKRGVVIPFTHVITKYDEIQPVLQQFQIGSAVIKPAYGASAFGVQKFAYNDPYLPEATAKLLEHSHVLVQAFMPEIQMGEISAMFFGKTFSHAVKKIPEKGDFRSNHEYGGMVEGITLDAGTQDAVNALFKNCNVDALYTRLDFVQTHNGLVLMELELITPYLFLEYDNQAKQRFIEAFKALS